MLNYKMLFYDKAVNNLIGKTAKIALCLVADRNTVECLEAVLDLTASVCASGLHHTLYRSISPLVLSYMYHNRYISEIKFINIRCA